MKIEFFPAFHFNFSQARELTQIDCYLKCDEDKIRRNTPTKLYSIQELRAGPSWSTGVVHNYHHRGWKVFQNRAFVAITRMPSSLDDPDLTIVYPLWKIAVFQWSSFRECIDIALSDRCRSTKVAERYKVLCGGTAQVAQPGSTVFNDQDRLVWWDVLWDDIGNLASVVNMCHNLAKFQISKELFSIPPFLDCLERTLICVFSLKLGGRSLCGHWDVENTIDAKN